MFHSEFEAYDLSGLNIVVVDDNRFMLSLMDTTLQALGVGRIRCFHNPTEVIAELKQQPAHLVITDIMMRPIDGIELTKTIRSSHDSIIPFTPIFVLSGRTDRESVMRAWDAGVHEVLVKPISPRLLYERIHRTIEYPVDFVRSDTYFGPERRAGQSGIAAQSNCDDVVYL